jgi:hypothetical protein
MGELGQARLQVALVHTVFTLWSKDLFIFFITFDVLCAVVDND